MLPPIYEYLHETRKGSIMCKRSSSGLVITTEGLCPAGSHVLRSWIMWLNIHLLGARSFSAKECIEFSPRFLLRVHKIVDPMILTCVKWGPNPKVKTWYWGCFLKWSSFSCIFRRSLFGPLKGDYRSFPYVSLYPPWVLWAAIQALWIEHEES